MRGNSPTAILAAALIALPVALCAPAAQAETPSLDAYGGEALVLGRPHRHRPGTGSASAGKAGAKSPSAGTSGPGARGHGSGAGKGAVGAAGIGGGRSGTPGGSSGGGTAGAGASRTGLRPAAGAPGSSAAGSGGAGGGGNSGSGASQADGNLAPSARSLPAGSSATALVDPYPTSTGRAGTGSALGGGEIVLILLGLAGIAAIGWTLRRARQGAH
jgi:hypothetical protein